MRLSGWHRLGLVASLLWILASSGAYFYELANHPSSLAALLPHSTYDWVSDPESTARAHVEALRNGKDFSYDYTFLKPTFSFPGLIAFSLTPIAAAWCLIYAFAAVFRWVRKGFEA
jgi:hypothetical protein